MRSNRIFTVTMPDGNKVVYEFRRPTQATIAKAELVGKAKFSEALRAGVILNAEAKKILSERGIWTDEQEKESQEMQLEIARLEEKLRDPQISNDEGVQLVLDIKRVRKDLDDYQAVLRDVGNGTCESAQQEEKNMFLAAECVFDKVTGRKVYKNLEEFKSRLDELSTVECYREATIAAIEVMLGQDLPSDIDSQYSENLWLAGRGLELGAELEEEAPEEEEELPTSTPATLQVKEVALEAPEKKRRGRKKKEEVETA